MAATVVRIADVVSAKRTPINGDLEGIVGRAKSLGNAVYVAFPSAGFAPAVLGGVFFTSSDTATTDPAGTDPPDPTVKVWGASPDGAGTLVQLDANLRVFLEAYSIALTELGIPLKSVGGTTAYARGSDPRIATNPNDNLHHGLALVLRVGAASADREATALVEYPILEALALLGATAREFQGPDEIPRSLEFQLSSHFFCSPDNTSKTTLDNTAWSVDIAALPHLHALGGHQTTKVGLLIAVAIGFMSAPTMLGAFAVASIVGPGSAPISLVPTARKRTWRPHTRGRG